jgi:hypothetical protein
VNDGRSSHEPIEHYAEFGRIPKSNFLAEAIEQGERQLAAAQAEAESKKAARDR